MANSITPPTELVGQWEEQFLERPTINGCFIQSYIAAKAAQWGADQELEACGRWIEDQLCMPPDARADVITKLNGSRRPNPPSLKQKLLQKLERISDVADGYQDTRNAIDDLRSALEALND